MRYDKQSPEWRRLFAEFEPRVDETRFCVCDCHGVLHNRAGVVTVEGRLGVLIDPVDHITACELCVVKHSYARWQEERKRRGAA